MNEEKRQEEISGNEETNKPVKQTGSNAVLDRLEDEIEHRFKVQSRIMSIMVKYIDPAVDISMIAGIPSKTSSFAHKLYRIIGGLFEYVKNNSGHPIVVKRKESDEKGDYYIYEAFGRYKSPFDDCYFEASGAFSSRNKFFGKTSEGFKPLEDVEEQNVRQAALTECFKKCIFGGLGFGKLTTEMLEKWGIDTSKIDGYEFRSGNKGGSTDSDSDKDMRAEIERVCRDLANDGYAPEGQFPFDNPIHVLKSITASTYKGKDGKDKVFGGYTSFEKITKKSLKFVHKKVMDVRASWERDGE